MIPSNRIGIPGLYRVVAPLYSPLRPLWAGTIIRAAESYLECVALPEALHPNAEVLDLGCGPASNLKRLKRLNLPFARYVGFDLSPAMVAKREPPGSAPASFVLGAAPCLPFADRSFDVVLSTWMFSHLPRPQLVVRQARRLLRPDGWLIVACFTRTSGLVGGLLRGLEPMALMRCVPLEEIESWPGLVEARTFARGCNAVVRVRKK